MSTTVAELRAAVKAAIEGVDGWRESRVAPDLFGRDTAHLLHHAFAVAVPTTENRDGKQGLVDGALVFSTIIVRWAHQLRGDAQSADYSAATTAEQAVVQAVVAIDSRHVLLQTLTREARAEGWVLGAVTFQAIHRYALS